MAAAAGCGGGPGRRTLHIPAHPVELWVGVWLQYIGHPTCGRRLIPIHTRAGAPVVRLQGCAKVTLPLPAPFLARTVTLPVSPGHIVALFYLSKPLPFNVCAGSPHLRCRFQASAL